MALIHNNVFDAALSYIATNASVAEVRDGTDTGLVTGVSLDAGNFGSPLDNAASSGGGRKITCLTSSASDMKNISVGTAGSAQKVALIDASTNVLIEASITSAPISLGASDQVNLSTFDTILKDPV